MAFPGQQQQVQQQMHIQQPPYNDSILTITEKSCADPYVLFDKGTYYMVSEDTVLEGEARADFRKTWTTGCSVEIWSAESLFDFEKRCKKDIIW